MFIHTKSLFVNTSATVPVSNHAEASATTLNTLNNSKHLDNLIYKTRKLPSDYLSYKETLCIG